MGFSTDAIHQGQEPDPLTGAVATPIYQTSTYALPAFGETKGYDYARTINPTRTALERNLAAIERGTAATAFSSGMAAISAVMTLLESGQHTIVSSMVYGGTYRLFMRILTRYGLSFSWVDTTRAEEIERALRPETRMIYLETPTNPVLEVSDIAAAARIARARNIPLVVDNTFMTPYLQRPLELGADVVVHSTTKYLNGHSDGVGGAAIVKDPKTDEWLKFVQNGAGAILSPFDCFLVLRGIKTLAVRMERHEHNARALAAFLAARPEVRKVYYPGLPGHPQHELQKRQASGFGAMIAFELGSLAAASTFLSSLKVITLAESLGGVESLACHPATMTHASIPKEDRERIGVTDGLVRISIGIEDAEDLVADAAQALQAASR
ncbi:MAG: PLP-dependent aspartate aminotransferase family protein [Acidobacteriota bacterium]